MFNANYIITGKIRCLTGLHIGGSTNSIEIGGSDNVIIRDAVNNLPYIPGSSLKGKLRSLIELSDEYESVKKDGEPIKTGFVADVFGASSDKSSDNYNINKEDENEIMDLIKELEERIKILEEGKKTHEDNEEVIVENNSSDSFVRLIVRDSYPTDETINNWDENINVVDGSELKYENSINRRTGVSNPRNIERVPQDSEFAFEIIFGIYNDNDDEEYAKKVYKLLTKGLNLLEDNYLGGSGSRGSGRVEIVDKKIFKRDKSYYEEDKSEEEELSW